MTQQNLSTQNISNHPRLWPIWHIVFFPFSLIVLGASFGFCYSRFTQDSFLAIVVLGQALAVFILMLFVRVYATRNQDKALLVDVARRWERLSGKSWDEVEYRLSTKQWMALRFADNSEFVALTEKTISAGLEPKSIKSSIQKWRQDWRRV